MNVSREFAIDQLKAVRKTLGDWVRDLEKPTVVGPDGKDVEAYQGEVPEGLSVSSIDGVPSEQLRAELIAMAGILEALATS